MPVRRKDTKNKHYEYSTPECFMQGCREVETHSYRVLNLAGPAEEWYCLKHAQRLIWAEYQKHVKETGRRS